MALYTELHIYKHGCELLSLAVKVQTQMPRMFKRSLGEKIHEKCMDMLEAMAMANAARDGARVEQLDTLLQNLRATTALLRVGHEQRLIAPKLWAESVELLDSIGAQAGGWRNHTLSHLSAAPAA
ncbi:MAG TPA: four helix bundle protein [Solimonas sp.]|nr:four helix bundle protein [Solimonas sp.]